MLVEPTSTRMLPLCSIISGTRKEPPISTSSPREMTTSLPLVIAPKISMTAAALLLTTRALSAPVSRVTSSSMWEYRLPRRPAATSYSNVE